MKTAKGLSKIMPLWTKKIERNDSLAEMYQACTVDGRTLDINQNMNCMVGEAYHFSSEYSNECQQIDYCEDCDKYAMDFYRILKSEYEGYEENQEKAFLESQISFLRHWKDEHDDEEHGGE